MPKLWYHNLISLFLSTSRHLQNQTQKKSSTHLDYVSSSCFLNWFRYCGIESWKVPTRWDRTEGEERLCGKNQEICPGKTPLWFLSSCSLNPQTYFMFCVFLNSYEDIYFGTAAGWDTHTAWKAVGVIWQPERFRQKQTNWRSDKVSRCS